MIYLSLLYLLFYVVLQYLLKFYYEDLIILSATFVQGPLSSRE
jgi:hypothetical protein